MVIGDHDGDRKTWMRAAVAPQRPLTGFEKLGVFIALCAAATTAIILVWWYTIENDEGDTTTGGD